MGPIKLLISLLLLWGRSSSLLGPIWARSGAEIEIRNGVWAPIGLLWAAAVRLGQLLLQLGEECLILLVQELGFLPQPLVLLHYVAVLQVQLRVQPLHNPTFSEHPVFSPCVAKQSERKQNRTKRVSQITFSS